jgi:glucan phosphoethanolaminetransferase (alkaline phosphatase superfamily)
MINNTKNVLLIIGAILVGLLLILLAVLVILDKDPTTYVGSLTSIVAILASSGILAAFIGSVKAKTDEAAEKTDQVAKSVNGNTSYLIDTIRELHGLASNTGDGKHVAPLDEERLSQIHADSEVLTGGTPTVQ